MKSGFIGIIGRTNVGKSTLLNGFLGEKIAITANKPQTTRNTIRGIFTDIKSEGLDKSSKEDYQMIFLDTPGIHKPKNKLGNFMINSALNTFKEVDVLLFLVEDILGEKGGDRYILEMLKEIKTPKILIINKIDEMSPEKYETIYKQYEETGIFEEIFGTSALKGKNVDKVLEKLKEFMPDGPMYFPEDVVTDHPERFIVSEIVREKTLMFLEQEVPHGIAIEIESYQEKKNITEIGVVIYCEKKSHKGIIIGKEGKKLKGIGKSARVEIENLLGTKVFLEIWVKVKENWRDSDFALSNFGYQNKE